MVLETTAPYTASQEPTHSHTPPEMTMDYHSWKDVICIPSTRDKVPEARRRLAAICRDYGVPDAIVEDIRLAACEAITNASEHGNHWDPSAQVRIYMRSEAQDGGCSKLEVCVEDESRELKNDCRQSMDDLNKGNFEHGRGNHLMRSLMDKVSDYFSGREQEGHRVGNVVLMQKSYTPVAR